MKEIMTKAWAIYRCLTSGTHSEKLSEALKMAWAQIKRKDAEKNAITVQDDRYMSYDDKAKYGAKLRIAYNLPQLSGSEKQVKYANALTFSAINGNNKAFEACFKVLAKAAASTDKSYIARANALIDTRVAKFVGHNARALAITTSAGELINSLK